MDEELFKMVGREGYLRIEQLMVKVQIHRAKTAFGRVDFLITPIGGAGEQWVSAERVKPVLTEV